MFQNEYSAELNLIECEKREAYFGVLFVRAENILVNMQRISVGILGFLSSLSRISFVTCL
jgi:hypothetical protein